MTGRFQPSTLRKLPVLEPRKRALETCVYCPKLCRSACPVSNAEPRETLIPWGKMSTAYFAARGDVPLEEAFASPAWACTGCHACRASCDHANDVAGTLFDARSAYAQHEIAPTSARAVIDGFGAHVERTRSAHQTLEGRRGRNGATLLIGCMYARRLPDVARDAVRVAAWLFGDVDVSPECCGLPLRLAGDKDAFERHASKMTSKPVVVVDPGCALALKSAGASVTLLVEHVGARVGDLPPGNGDARVMWHDPCQLGRGLGIYDAPRAVLTRVTGRAPDEFAMHHERAECSGAGGLLPLTMPEVSASIAAKRAEGARGQEIVTGCASSVVRFRRAGVPASDIVSWVARSL